MHGCMIFTPKSENNTQNQQAQRKKTVTCTMAIPGFLKAFVDSHTFLYSKTSKTPTSFLFSILCFASLLFLSLFFPFFLASPLISLFSFHSLTCLKNPTRLSPINPSDLLYAFSSHASLHLLPTTTMGSHVFATRPCSLLPAERGPPHSSEVLPASLKMVEEKKKNKPFFHERESTLCLSLV